MLFTRYVFWSLLLTCSWTYELHDTIETLKEKNLHLQQQLENLTSDLSDLEHLLMEYPEGETTESQRGRDDPDDLHVWRDRSQHGVAEETHRMLRQVLCEAGLRGAAQTSLISRDFFFLSVLLSWLLLA